MNLSKTFAKAVALACLGMGAQSVLAQHGPPSKSSTEGFAPPRAVNSKKPCANEKECDSLGDNTVTLENGVGVGRVVKRTVTASGAVEEYVTDSTIHFNKRNKVLPQQTWSPPKEMKFEEAKAYCKNKKDLGLKWRLPDEEDFRVAFNPKNPDKSVAPVNSHFKEAMGQKDIILWSSSSSSSKRAEDRRIYSGTYGQISDAHYAQDYPTAVSCVGR